MPFEIKIEPEAELDIQTGIDWYNEQMPGLGVKFHAEVKAHLNTLKTNLIFHIRYDDVRCLPLKKHPFMIHFTISEEQKKGNRPCCG